jgi:hypothetical protein
MLAFWNDPNEGNGLITPLHRQQRGYLSKKPALIVIGLKAFGLLKLWDSDLYEL